MIFNTHSYLEGKHAFLGASNYHWLNYTEEKLDESFKRAKAKELGIRLHDFAAEAIEMGIHQDEVEKTLNLYINDAIGYKMQVEQVLYYSEHAFGTVDAISYRRKMLRIHDLKTGITKASFKQLMIYAAYFCLEYDIKPADIKIELRIYQYNGREIYKPTTEEIVEIMEKVVKADKRVKILTLQESKG